MKKTFSNFVINYIISISDMSSSERLIELYELFESVELIGYIDEYIKK